MYTVETCRLLHKAVEKNFSCLLSGSLKLNNYRSKCNKENEMKDINLMFIPFKVNNKNAKKRSEICSKLTIKTPERRQ